VTSTVPRRLSAAWRRVIEVVAVLVAYTAVWMAVTWDVVTHWGSRIYGVAGDPVGSTWWLWQYAKYLGYSLVGTTTITMSGAPIGWMRGDAVNLQAVLLYGPATLAAKVVGPVGAYNLMVITGMVLSSAAMYWLIRWLGFSWVVAGWAGVAYMFFPWHTLKAGIHVTFTHLWLFPVLVLVTLWWLRQPSWRRAALVGAVGLGLWLSSGYFGIVGFVGICAMAVVGWVILGRRTRRWGVSAGTAALPVAFGVLAAVLVYAIGSIGGGMAGGLSAQDVRGLDVYGARLHQFLLPVGANPVFGSYTGDYLDANLHGGNDVESPLFVGWLTLALALAAVIWLIVARRQMAPVHRWASAMGIALVGVAFVFMLPSPFTFLGREWTMPSKLIYDVTPSFRVPTRFMPLLMTGMVVLAAIGLGLIIRRLAPALPAGALRNGVVAVSCALLAAFSFGELTTVPPGPVYEVGEREWVGMVKKTPPGVLAQYPLFGTTTLDDPDNLLQQTFHERPLGFNAPGDTLADEARTEVLDVAAPGTAGRLAGFGVTAITLRPQEQQHEGVLLPARTSPGPGYRLVGRAGDGTSVWTVTARPDAAVAVPWSGFTKLELRGKPAPRRWMDEQVASVAIFSRAGGLVRASFIAGSWGRPRAITVTGQEGMARRQLPAWTDTPVDLLLRVPAGLSAVTLRANPGPSRGPAGAPVVMYMTQWAFRAVSAGASAGDVVTSAPIAPDGSR